MDEHDEEQLARDIRLHVAKLIEHMEWENTLPEQQRLTRRITKYIAGIAQAAKTSVEFDMPWLFIGHMQILFDAISDAFGADWMERARQERKGFLYGDGDEDDGMELDEGE